MPYQYATKTFDDNPARPTFIVAGRLNMLDPVMKLDHRIPWLCLRTALNKVLSGAVDSQLINALMMLSPSRDTSVITAFTTAVRECRAGTQPKDYQRVALETIEQEIFSLPANLALGLNNRADDPGGTGMDFTPDDIDYAGNPTSTPAGALQKLREKLFGALSASTIDPKGVKQICQAMVDAIGRANLNAATAANFNNWHPGPPAAGIARTYPGYRYWRKPTGEAMTAQEILANVTKVTHRALAA